MEKTAEKALEHDAQTVYELSYIILPTLDEAQATAQADALKAMVKTHGGALVSDENPVMIDLAYSMTKVVGVTRHKATTGHFGWMKFEMLQDGIESVKKAMDAADTVLRYLIVKTVRENTLLNGKMMLKKEDAHKKEDVLGDDASLEGEAGVVGETAPVEGLDKSIDDLVIA